MIPLIDFASVHKDYRGLRPLRIQRLTVGSGDHVALVGFDRVTAELFVNLVTGATLPDSGEIRVFGKPTSSITDSTEWMGVVDRFGIVSERAVLLDGLTVVQNLAVPFSLEIEPPSEDVRLKATALAAEVGLSPEDCHRRVGELDPTSRMLVRLGRALALEPSVILLEHPSAGVPRETIEEMGAGIQTIIGRRRAASVTLTADVEFAHAIARTVLTLEPSTGRLNEARSGWLSRLAKKTRGG